MFQDYWRRRNILRQDLYPPRNISLVTPPIVRMAGLLVAASPSNALAQGWGGGESIAVLSECSIVWKRKGQVSIKETGELA